ncbi:hypothetical protein [uncultured Tenacibaculum sp.]|uniref:hypothetical protein n=1 Tax=uncultured Tenacibaculum sp. TaxID=174713 RepID=UPI002615FD42|nr:hypothetical protein [uncultured Tenacibaculum sp.]
MKKLLALLFVYPTIMFSQLDKQSIELNRKLDNLLELIENGDRKAISDVSVFLDDKRQFIRKRGQNTNTTNLREVALSILYYYTDFEGLSINDSLTTSSFKKFLYNNNLKIKYSNLLNKFINIPLSERKVEYRLRKLNKEIEEEPSLRAIKLEIKELVGNGRYYNIIEKIESAARLKSNEAFEFLKECAEGRYWDNGENDRGKQIYSGICYSLRHFKTIESAKLIVEILENHEVYSIDECILALSKITNVDLVIKNQSYENITQEYKQLFEAYPSIKELKKFGYEAVFKNHDFDPDNIAEFYGTVLLNSSDYWWINYHALQDIFESNDPLSLRYVGSQLHRKVSIYNDHLGRVEFDIIKIMEEKTGVKLEVKDRTGNWTANYNDDVAKVNYLVYWYNHYKDYKWNSLKKQFENTYDQILEPDYVSILFKKLFNKNDSIALNAYLQLTQQKPEIVKSKINQYNLSSFGDSNGSLPMFAEKFLLQLVELTAYCENHKVIYLPSNSLVSEINVLDKTKSFKKKYQIENKLIQSLNIKDITPLEYYTLINNKANSSVSRILDKWYSKNWDKIVGDNKELKLYLKKSALYDRLGIIGNVNKYAFKFNNAKPSTIKKLKALVKLENDEDIKAMALKVLNNYTDSTKKEKIIISLSDFLTNKKNRSEETASLVKVNTEEDYEALFGALAKADKKEANNLITIIMRNVNVNMTPFLIKSLTIKTLVDQGNISRHDKNMNYHSISYNIFVSDKIIACLEHIHNHVFPIPQDPKLDVKFVSSSRSSSSYFRNKHKTANKWGKLFEKNAQGYKNWGRNFYLNRIKKLKKKDSITIQDINVILSSEYYKNEDKSLVFSSLAKVKPKNAISYLELKEGILGMEDIRYFRDASFNAGDLERVVTIFKGLPPKKIIDYIKEVSKNFEPSERGKMYYNLMWNTQFKNWVKEINISSIYKEEIIEALKAYRNILRKDSFNYLYVNKFIGVIEFQGEPIENVLQKVIAMKSEGTELAKSILKDANYKDLGTVLKYYKDLPITDYKRLEYLTRDLGFCLMDDYSDELINEFNKNYEAMSEAELYSFYLDKTGVVYKKNGKLDFEKIYNVLEFNLVDGFIGGRDYERHTHVYSIIRLLELYFNKHFGEDRKFNNSVSNMLYSVSEKAFLWMKFLKEKGHVKLTQYNVPSISNVK